MKCNGPFQSKWAAQDPRGLHDLGHVGRDVHDPGPAMLDPLEEVLVGQQRDIRAVLHAAADVVHLAVDVLLEDERRPFYLPTDMRRLGTDKPLDLVVLREEPDSLCRLRKPGPRDDGQSEGVGLVDPID